MREIKSDLYKVVIIDDEPHVTEGLRDLISWEAYGFTVIKVFDFASEAITFIKTCAVDLVITDIRMPVINGHELVKQLKESHLSIEVLIMSGYREFSDVKEAMSLGVQDYLVKPIFEEDIVPILEKTYQIITQKNQKAKYKSLYEGESIRAFIKGVGNQALIKSQLTELELSMKAQEGWRCVSISCFKENEGIIDQYIRKYMNLDIGSNSFYLLQQKKYNQIMLVRFKEPEPVYKQRIMYEKMPMIILISPKVEGLEELKKIYKKMVTMEKYLTRYSYNACKEIRLENEWQEEYIQVISYVRALLEGIERQEEVIIYKTVKKLFYEVAESKVHIRTVKNMVTNIYTDLLSTLKKHMDNHEKLQILSSVNIPVDTDRMEELVAFLLDSSLALMKIIGDYQENKRRDFINSIELYMQEHLSENLTIKELAEVVHLHPNYLGQKLTQSFGESFAKKLNRMRIEKAVDRLKEKKGTVSIEEIAYQVGYNNYHQFLKYFKLQMKMTPKQFLKSIC